MLHPYIPTPGHEFLILCSHAGYRGPRLGIGHTLLSLVPQRQIYLPRSRSNGSLNEPRSKGCGEERGLSPSGRPRGGGDEGDGPSQEENTPSLRQVLVLEDQVQRGAPMVSAGHEINRGIRVG